MLGEEGVLRRGSPHPSVDSAGGKLDERVQRGVRVSCDSAMGDMIVRVLPQRFVQHADRKVRVLFLTFNVRGPYFVLSRDPFRGRDGERTMEEEPL